MIGRKKGISGIRDDIYNKKNIWHNKKYEVKLSDDPATNWINISQFVEAVDNEMFRIVDRNLNNRLRLRADRHHCSMQEEVCAILNKALDSSLDVNLGDSIRQRVASVGGVELAPHPPVTVEAPPSLDPEKAP